MCYINLDLIPGRCSIARPLESCWQTKKFSYLMILDYQILLVSPNSASMLLIFGHLIWAMWVALKAA